MANQYSRLVVLVAVCLLMVPSSIAVWDDSTGIILVSEGEVLSLGEHSVKLIDASIDEGFPFLEVKRKGTVLFKGFIELEKPVKVDHEIFIEYLGPSTKVRYGSQIKLRVYQWVDAKIVNAHFPRYLNREARYNVWMEVVNSGAKDVVFNSQLTQEGAYIVRSGQYMLPDGTLTPIILDLGFPIQNVYIPSSSLQRVQYNDISGNRRQTSLLDDPQVRAGNSIEKNANVLFNLYFKGVLLDSFRIPNVNYGKSPSGYIEDIEIPDVLVQNQEYESKAFILNGGPGGNTIDAGKLNLQLLTKGFTIGPSSNKLKKSPELQTSEDLLRKSLLTGERDDWRFTLTAHVPAGEYDVKWRLWQNRHDYLYSTYDEFSKRVRVLANPNRLVERFVLPPSVNVGETILVEVRLSNVGVGQLLNVNVRAPTLLDNPVKRVVTIPTDSMLSLSFAIPALISGKAPITVEVYPHKANNFKWNDPYSESGSLLDSVTKTVEVLDGEEGPSLPPLPWNELPPQPREQRAVPSIITAPIQATVDSSISESNPFAPEGLIPPLPSEFDIPPLPRVSEPSSPRLGEPSEQGTFGYSGYNGYNEKNSGLIAVLVLVIIVVLLAFRVVINFHRRSRRIEAHQAVERHLRKK